MSVPVQVDGWEIIFLPKSEYLSYFEYVFILVSSLMPAGSSYLSLEGGVRKDR